MGRPSESVHKAVQTASIPLDKAGQDKPFCNCARNSWPGWGLTVIRADCISEPVSPGTHILSCSARSNSSLRLALQANHFMPFAFIDPGRPIVERNESVRYVRAQCIIKAQGLKAGCPLCQMDRWNCSELL